MGHLVLKETLGTLAVFSSPVLVLFRGSLVDMILQLVEASTNSLPSIKAGLGTVSLVVGRATSRIGRVSRAVGIGSLVRSLGDIAELTTVDGLVLVSLFEEPLLELVFREIGSIVPLVIGGGVVDLSKLVFGRTDTGGSPGGGVTGNIAEENNSIVEELAELTETMLTCVLGASQSITGPTRW